MIRLMFVNSRRVADSIATLSFDNFVITDTDQTYIFYGPEILDYDLIALYQSHGINTSNFNVVVDQDLLNQFKLMTLDVDIYKFGGHISQQALKLIALDLADAHQVLIQDCDTFAIKPYQCFDNLKPVPFVVNNPILNSEFYDYYMLLTGTPRSNPLSFVTEFMPVDKQHWNSLKQHIENQFSQHWLIAMYKLLDQTFTTAAPFSEYEILGNWQSHCDPTITPVAQVSYKINSFPKQKRRPWEEYNCCGVNPGYLTLDNVQEFIKSIQQGNPI